MVVKSVVVSAVTVSCLESLVAGVTSSGTSPADDNEHTTMLGKKNCTRIIFVITLSILAQF